MTFLMHSPKTFGSIRRGSCCGSRWMVAGEIAARKRERWGLVCGVGSESKVGKRERGKVGKLTRLAATRCQLPTVSPGGGHCPPSHSQLLLTGLVPPTRIPSLMRAMDVCASKLSRGFARPCRRFCLREARFRLRMTATARAKCVLICKRVDWCPQVMSMFSVRQLTGHSSIQPSGVR